MSPSIWGNKISRTLKNTNRVHYQPLAVCDTPAGLWPPIVHPQASIWGWSLLCCYNSFHSPGDAFYKIKSVYKDFCWVIQMLMLYKRLTVFVLMHPKGVGGAEVRAVGGPVKFFHTKLKQAFMSLALSQPCCCRDVGSIKLPKISWKTNPLIFPFTGTKTTRVMKLLKHRFCADVKARGDLRL